LDSRGQLLNEGTLVHGDSLRREGRCEQNIGDSQGACGYPSGDKAKKPAGRP
jgi:hypothetical protein